jgi:DNA-binding PadR family transcriptional regulator
MLYGRSRVPRSHRRIMTAMLAAPGTPAWDLTRLAQAPVPVVTVFLVRMQTLGWAEMDREPVSEEDRRIRYRLTGTGEACIRRLLGLDPDPWPKLKES